MPLSYLKILSVGFTLKNTKSILFFSALWFFSNLISQSNFREFEFKKSIQIDKEIDPNINDIIQDSTGYIWFATENGLYRFDGDKLNTYKSNDVLPNTLLHNRIFDLELDSNGDLWIASSGGLMQYNKNANNFVPVFPKQKNVNKDVYVQTVQFDSKGNCWFSTSHFLWVTNPNTSKLDSIALPNTPGKDSDPFIHTFLISSDNEIFISVDRILYRLNRNSKKFELIHALPIQEKDMVMHIEEDKEGRIWTVSREGKVFHFDVNSKKYTEILSDNTFSGVFQLSNKQLFFTNSRKGIGQFTEATQKIEKCTNPYFDYPDHQHVSVVFRDAQGIFWLGHKENGVSYAYPYQNFKIISNTDFRHQELQSNMCSALLIDQTKTLWIGSSIGGLYHVQAKQNGVSFLKNNLFPYTELACLYQDENRTIWIGTYDEGVFILNEKGIILKKIPQLHDVRKIIQDKKGIYWILSHGKGMYSYDAKKELLTNYSSLQNSALAPKGDWTFDIICDQKNQLWIATNLGLSCLNQNRNVIKHYCHEKGKKKTIVSNDLRCLLEDSQGKIWCGTLEGISILNPEKGLFIHVKPYEGIFFVSMIQDLQSNIWAGTDNGLYKINVNGKILRHYTLKDGLPSNSFLEKAALKSLNGDLYFGSNKGLVYFSPASLQINKYQPQPVINSIINNEKELLNTIEVSEQKDGKWVLGYNENNFTFSFAALNFIYPENNSFAYRLMGYDTTWIYTSDRKATFTNLNSGNYIFEVKSANNDGIWSSKKATFAFTITVPWYKSIVAIIFYFLLIAVFTTTIYRVIVYRIRTSKALLIEQTKTEQLEELYESKINFFTNISHDIRTPLSLIYGPIESILKSSKLDENNKTLLTLVQRNTRQLLKLVNELLEFKKIESDKSPVYLDVVHLNTLLEQLSEDFKLAAFQKNIQFNFTQFPEVLFIKANASLLERAIQNLLVNAFKFTPVDGTIHLVLKSIKQNEQLVALIEIQDSGAGIPEELHDNLFSQFYEGKNSTGSGLGLFIVKKVLEQIKGKIEVENNKGALFRIYLPTIEGIQDEEKKLFIEADEEIKPLKSKLILVVEDNTDLRNYIQQVLTPYFTVLTAENGAVGFKMALSSTPDLILSDIMMPEVDGLALCAKIKNSLQTSHIPVLMLTAKSNDISEQDALKIGADDYIQKPFDPKNLVLKIRNILETKANQLHKFNTEKGDYSALSAESMDAQFLDNFKELIQKEFSNADLSIENLCEEIGLSRSQLYKKVMALTGSSPVDYIQELRIREAMHLLKSTALSVSEIAFRVGYNDSRYFSNRFKKFTNSTPGEFRNKS